MLVSSTSLPVGPVDDDENTLRCLPFEVLLLILSYVPVGVSLLRFGSASTQTAQLAAALESAKCLATQLPFQKGSTGTAVLTSKTANSELVIAEQEKASPNRRKFQFSPPKLTFYNGLIAAEGSVALAALEFLRLRILHFQLQNQQTRAFGTPTGASGERDYGSSPHPESAAAAASGCKQARIAIAVGPRAAQAVHGSLLFIRREVGIHPLVNLELAVDNTWRTTPTAASGMAMDASLFASSMRSDSSTASSDHRGSDHGAASSISQHLRDDGRIHVFNRGDIDRHFSRTGDGTITPRVLCCLSPSCTIGRGVDDAASVLAGQFNTLLTPTVRLSFSPQHLSGEIRRLFRLYHSLASVNGSDPSSRSAPASASDRASGPPPPVVHLIVDIMMGQLDPEGPGEGDKWLHMTINTLRQLITAQPPAATGAAASAGPQKTLGGAVVVTTLLVDVDRLHRDRRYMRCFMRRWMMLERSGFKRNAFGLIDTNRAHTSAALETFHTLFVMAGNTQGIPDGGATTDHDDADPDDTHHTHHHSPFHRGSRGLSPLRPNVIRYLLPSPTQQHEIAAATAVGAHYRDPLVDMLAHRLTTSSCAPAVAAFVYALMQQSDGLQLSASGFFEIISAPIFPLSPLAVIPPTYHTLALVMKSIMTGVFSSVRPQRGGDNTTSSGVSSMSVSTHTIELLYRGRVQHYLPLMRDLRTYLDAVDASIISGDAPSAAATALTRSERRHRSTRQRNLSSSSTSGNNPHGTSSTEHLTRRRVARTALLETCASNSFLFHCSGVAERGWHHTFAAFCTHFLQESAENEVISCAAALIKQEEILAVHNDSLSLAASLILAEESKLLENESLTSVAWLIHREESEALTQGTIAFAARLFNALEEEAAEDNRFLSAAQCFNESS